MEQLLSFAIVEYYKCPKCGFVFTIWRKGGWQRKLGHKKRLYCPKCKEENNFVCIEKEKC